MLPDFSAEALGEPGKLRIPAGIVDGSVKGPQHVPDMRSLLWASIGNDDSRDLDQLTVTEAICGDTVKIWVAIADADSLVKYGSAIDEHARHNTTSVYTAAEIFRMLPERVSTDLTSLNPSQDHLSIVVETVVDADGFLQDSGIYRSWVRNHAKPDYGSLGAWLENEGAIPPKGDEIWLPKIGGAGIKLPAYLTWGKRSTEQPAIMNLMPSDLNHMPAFKRGTLSDPNSTSAFKRGMLSNLNLLPAFLKRYMVV